MGLKQLATFPLATRSAGHAWTVVIAKGSVLDFGLENPPPVRGAIVNAANEVCLGGGGVDGAITDAGGPSLADLRLALPLLPSTTSPGLAVRCPTGHAVMTGPGDFGEIHVPYVIHAVGPNFFMYQPGEWPTSKTPEQLLQSAYQVSLDLCLQHEVTDVAFSLLSAGVYRGDKSLDEILTLAISSVKDWSLQQETIGSLRTVTFCAFSTAEANCLEQVCQQELS